MRKFFILSCLVALVFLMAFPASAAILSWEDYILEYDEDSVTCQLPNDEFFINIMISGSVVSTYTGSTVSYPFPNGVVPRFQVWPMGAKNRMRLSDIPEGTTLQYRVTFTKSGSKALHGNLIAYIEYFDADIESLGSTIIASGEGTLPKTFDITHVMDFPEGAEYFTLWFYLQGWDTLTAATSMGISCSPLTFTMDIKYLTDDSAILNSINDQLNDINSQIKDPDPVPPSGSDDISDVIEQEENLLAVWNEYVDSYNDHLGIGSGILLDRAASFAAVALMVDDFASTGFFYELITISLIIGVVGFLLGSSMYAFSRLTRGSSRLKGEYANIGGKVRRIG